MDDDDRNEPAIGDETQPPDPFPSPEPYSVLIARRREAARPARRID